MQRQMAFEGYGYRTSSRFGNWARNGLWLVILPHVAEINKMSEGHAVSFEAPAGETRGNAVQTLHARREEEYAELGLGGPRRGLARCAGRKSIPSWGSAVPGDAFHIGGEQEAAELARLLKGT